MIIAIVGNNNYQASQKLQQLKISFEAEFGNSNLVDLNAQSCSYEDLNSALVSQGLFSSSSMVIIRDMASNKLLQEQLLDKLEELPDAAKLVIYEPQIDRRTAFFKKLKLLDEFYDFVELNEQELIKWTRNKYKEMGGEIGYSEASFLVKRVNLDQWALFHELNKLINFGKPITISLIEKMVDESFNETIFKLLDLAFSKQQNEALIKYRKLRENRVEPQYVLSMIIWQLHILMVIAYAGKRPTEQIASEHKISPFVISKSQKLMQQTSVGELKKLIELVNRIDSNSKTKASYDIDNAVDMLIAKIAS